VTDLEIALVTAFAASVLTATFTYLADRFIEKYRESSEEKRIAYALLIGRAHDHAAFEVVKKVIPIIIGPFKDSLLGELVPANATWELKHACAALLSDFIGEQTKAEELNGAIGQCVDLVDAAIESWERIELTQEIRARLPRDVLCAQSEFDLALGRMKAVFRRIRRWTDTKDPSLVSDQSILAYWDTVKMYIDANEVLMNALANFSGTKDLELRATVARFGRNRLSGVISDWNKSPSLADAKKHVAAIIAKQESQPG